MEPKDQEKIYIDALLARLMELLNRDKAEVMRRIERVKQRYPQEKPTWYLVKTIWEVEQDALMFQGMTRAKRPATSKPAPKPIVTPSSAPATPSALARLAGVAESRYKTIASRIEGSLNLFQDHVPIQPNQKLLQLLHGDRAAAQRLLDSAQIQNPGCTAQWVHEKVMWDLQRDRT